MKAELVSIGSELVNGQSLDTNSQWLSVQLANIGVSVGFHSTAADDLETLVETLASASRRSQLVLITGGLGPTQDDITREAMARLGQVSLILHADSFEAIRTMFEQRGREMPERNRVQAMFPAGSEPIPNDAGTAPGIWMKHDQTTLIAMPGVPYEMYRMFQRTVRPRLIGDFGLARFIAHRKINTFGAGESTVEEKLFDLTRRGRDPEVGITASDATISLRISTSGKSEQEAMERIEPTANTIYERLGTLIFGEADETLEQVVSNLLKSRAATVSLAEGVTGGLIATRLCDVAGSSQYLLGAVVAYSVESKIQRLNVPRELIAEHGVVSEPVVGLMAEHCLRLFDSDYAIATTGIPGPKSRSREIPVGTLCVAVASKHQSKTRTVNVIGNRTAMRSRSAKCALNELRLLIQEDGSVGSS